MTYNLWVTVVVDKSNWMQPKYQDFTYNNITADRVGPCFLDAVSHGEMLSAGIERHEEE